MADGLPVAGQTGTLSDAFAGNPAVGRLRAKTGTLRDAKALSGFVDAPDGARHISFSYIQNGPNAEAAAGPGLGCAGASAHRLSHRAADRPARPGARRPATLTRVDTAALACVTIHRPRCGGR